MARAIVPTEMPPIPDGFTRWRRSLRRGSVYHLTTFLGTSACRSMNFERNKSEGPRQVGDMQFWGVCPRCFAKATKGGQK